MTVPSPLFGTLDTQASTAMIESQAGVSVAMFEFNWASFEPSPGVFSASYRATMQSYLQAYQAAGMRVTLGLGLQNPPPWVFSLPDSTYTDQAGDVSDQASFVFSQAVRTAAASYLAQIAADIPLSMDSWSATRWIGRIAAVNGLLVAGENPGYDMPASLNSFYVDRSSSGMMATAITQARSGGFQVLYWAHDVHLWDGIIPFWLYASMISQ
jgi:hypothetical protein